MNVGYLLCEEQLHRYFSRFGNVLDGAPLTGMMHQHSPPVSPAHTSALSEPSILDGPGLHLPCMPVLPAAPQAVRMARCALPPHAMHDSAVPVP